MGVQWHSSVKLVRTINIKISSSTSPRYRRNNWQQGWRRIPHVVVISPEPFFAPSWQADGPMRAVENIVWNLHVSIGPWWRPNEAKNGHTPPLSWCQKTACFSHTQRCGWLCRCDYTVRSTLWKKKTESPAKTSAVPTAQTARWWIDCSICCWLERTGKTVLFLLIIRWDFTISVNWESKQYTRSGAAVIGRWWSHFRESCNSGLSYWVCCTVCC